MWRRLAMPLVRPVTVAVALARVHRLVGQLPRPARLRLRPRPLHAAARAALAGRARPHELPGAPRGRGRRDGAGRRRVRVAQRFFLHEVVARGGSVDEQASSSRGSTKRYRRTVTALDGVDLEVARRGAARRRRAVGLRKEHAPAVHRRARGRRRRDDLDRRPRRHARASGRAQRLDGVPELRALPAPDGRGEHRLRPRRPRDAEGARSRSASPSSRARRRAASCSSAGPYQLSGGERQRVALARALVRRARCLPARRAALESRRRARASRRGPSCGASTARSARRWCTSPTTRSRR